MAASQRVLAWGDQAVPRAPRQERANGAPHPNHPANQGTAQVRRSWVGLGKPWKHFYGIIWDFFPKHQTLC